MVNRIRLREVTIDDCQKIFDWRNSDFIIRNGLQANKVEWQEHYTWLSKRILDTQQLIYIIEAKGIDIGVVRIDNSNKAPETKCISIYVIEVMAGQGIGPICINMACDMAFQKFRAVQRIEANILRENKRSIRAFQKADFIISKEKKSEEEHRLLIKYRK